MQYIGAESRSGYVNETRRLISVLESRLKSRKYLVGEKYTLADIKTFPWYVTEAFLLVGILTISLSG
jgi:glutathione S-transferase